MYYTFSQCVKTNISYNTSMSLHLGFKERLSEEISYQGISNKEFAAKINISINTLNMYLYRDSIPSADIAVKMANTLNTSVEYLITGHDERIKNMKDKTNFNWQKTEVINIIDNLSPQQLSCFLDIARAYKNSLIK